MFGRALDAADHERDALSFINYSANATSTTEGSEFSRGYGSTASSKTPSENSDEEGSTSWSNLPLYDDGTSCVLNEWQERRRSCTSINEQSVPVQFLKVFKEFCVLVINIEDVWDSPNPAGEVSCRSYAAVLFWFSVLATAYATERASFKLLVDRAGPFRLFSAEVIAIVHCSVVGVGIIGRSLQRKHFELKPLGVSLIDVGCKSNRISFTSILC